MESEAETKGNVLKNVGGQVCQICGDNAGMSVDGEPFVAWMSVHFQFADHAMNMRGRTEISLALSAKPNTRDIKEVLRFMVMERRMLLAKRVLPIFITLIMKITRRFQNACLAGK